VIRFLALGDSYTIGESVDVNDRWPLQLVRLLRENHVAIDDPTIIARTGWTTDELDAGISAENPSGTFDLVSLLIGVNNQYRGRSEEEYRGQFRQLLQRAMEFAGNNPSHVLVLSIPDWGVTPFAEGKDRTAIGIAINHFNSITMEEAHRVGAHYINITPFSREASHDRSLTAEDGLHPSGPMYATWAAMVLPIALKILQSGPD
jgi:lysophospholipase L1-like esterase